MKRLSTLILAVLLVGCNTARVGVDTPSISNLMFGEAVIVSPPNAARKVEVQQKTTSLTLSTQFGFTFDYHSTTSNPVFKLIISMPGKVKKVQLRGVKTKVDHSNSTVEMKRNFYKPSGDFGYILNFSEDDPAGKWRFNFYLDDVFQESITAEVKKP